ncbi:MAG: hypothetical protein EXR59_02480 [Dehalococcoidia bacterium]|nr:hypothetical protein [Dehalococcoidia bacterium]
MKLILSVVIFLFLLVAGKALFNAPLPNISLGGEKVIPDLFSIGSLGSFNLTNTLLGAWVAGALILIVSLVATRKMKLVPSGVQAVVEWSIEGMLKLVEDIAGKEKGRKIFSLVTTIFLFILISTWTGLLPFYNGIGKTVSAEHLITETAEGVIKESLVGIDKEHAQELAEEFYQNKLTGEAINEVRVSEHKNFPEKGDKVTTGAGLNDKIMAKLKSKKLFIMDKAGGLTFLNIGFKSEKLGGLGLLRDRKEVSAKDYYVTIVLEKYDPALSKEVSEAKNIKEQKELLGLGDVNEDGSGSAVAAEFLPYFRSANSDLMMTLAIAFTAMIAIEFWGITGNGLLKYAGRFINFSDFKKGPLMGVIGLFVGILEAISEFAKVISFTFRLFGNIVAGEILVFVFLFLLPFLTVIIPLGLEVFVGFIQAIVFAGLVLVFATSAMESHEGHHEGAEAGHEASHPATSHKA